MGRAATRLTANNDVLIRSIYDAALDDDSWSNLAGVLVDFIGADSGIIHYMDGETLDQSNGHHSEATLNAYADHYRLLDPFLKSFANMACSHARTRGWSWSPI